MKRVAQAPPFFFVSWKTEPQRLRILVETADENACLAEGRRGSLIAVIGFFAGGLIATYFILPILL